MEITLVALITSLLYAFVEEGFTFQVRQENLAIFVGVLFGLIIVTFFYEGIESLIEYFLYDQIVKFDWNHTCFCSTFNNTLHCYDLPLDTLQQQYM